MSTEKQYPITSHARRQLAERWPDTILRPSAFDWVTVPTEAPIIGYDPASSAILLVVPETPMVAVVVGGVVSTFLTLQAAEANIALRGFGRLDFCDQARVTNKQIECGRHVNMETPQ